ncbi:MAG: aminotransferase class V-fold PLP-dependent enzyme, partial [Clostridia bacterium]|nr:aminotransferase class V-fold PLP-dependent enzyme [Clostridia bacterium]
ETRKRGVLFMVDASQSAGSTIIDTERSNIDILAFPGHKGLLGPQGSGGLYIRKGIDIIPLTEGGTGSLSESLLQPDILPDRYESGTLNVPSIVGLLSGVKYLQKVGIYEIERHEKELSTVLAEDFSMIKGVKLVGSPFSGEHSAVLSIVTPVDCISLADKLYSDYGICVRAGLHCAPLAHKTLGTFDTGTVRFSPGPFTTKPEIKKAAYALYRCLKESKKNRC